MPSSSQSLTDLQQGLVEEFGTLYESYGFKRLKGLIVGLVLTQSAPVSLDDITELLGRSKGPISSAVRELASIGIIRKVNGPVARRDYYEADENLFYNNFRHNMDIVRKNRRIAERYLQRIPNTTRSDEDGTSPADYAAMKANMKQMHAFYTLMESFYADFSERWAEVRSQEFGTEALRNG
ncbi:MAG: transcriptional regulator [Bacteroidetes bacterium]|jgi:DNA-binding transcriptional regulator GbsR (MarR family)|nr:transcriptional regulator [Bacteroidota bacterium]